MMGPLIVAMAVAGTAAFSTVKPPALDTVEYSHVIQLTHLSTQAVKGCKDHNFAVDALEQQAELLVEYESHLPKSVNNLYAAKEVVFLTKQFQRHQQPSIRYCQHKFSEIQSVSRTLARALGGLHQFDICDSDFEDRIALYETSFKKQQITEEEFKELLEDIKHIAKTDRSACSTENSVKLDQAMKLISEAAMVVQGI